MADRTRRLKPLKLEQDPLVFVLAQVRFAPVLQMEEHVANLQGELRRRNYPRFHREDSQEITIGPAIQAKTSTRWTFASRENDKAIVLGQDFVVLECTTYDVFDSFSKDLEEALELVGAVADVAFSDRIGLRYVDSIRPQPSQDLSHYLHTQLLGLPAPSLGVTDATSQYQFLGQTDIGQLLVRLVQASEKTPLPPDLTTSLKLKAINDSLPATLLDIDHFSALDRDYDPAGIIDDMWRLHEFTDLAFRTAVTEEALKQWEAEEI